MTPNAYMYGDNANSTNTPLLSSGSFTGTARDMAEGGYAGIILAILTDVPGTLYAEQSVDGIHWDSSIEYDIDGGTAESHRLVVTRKFYRTRYVNNGTAQGYMRLQTMYNHPAVLSSPFNSTLQQDADAVATRSFPPELEIAAGRFQGVSLVNKFGRTPSLSMGTSINDIITTGGEYTGFPVTAPEELQAFSSSASDTGTLTFVYLASSSSTEYQTASVTLNGVTPVNTGITAYRVHTMRYDSGDDTTFNVGTLTLRWRTTTSVVFMTILPGRSQANYAVYTVPAGYTGFIQTMAGAIRGGVATAAVDGSLWIRGFGESPRLRRPFTIGISAPMRDDIYGGIEVAQKSDIKLSLSNVTANNSEVIGSFDLVLVRNP